MAELFRKKALERLQSPEQLDQLLTVTSTRSWLALLSLCALAAAAVVWGILGNVATKVYGTGILTDPGGFREVVAIDRGQVIKINVQQGSRVASGTVIATMINPDLAEQLAVKKQKLDELKQQRTELTQRLDAQYSATLLELKRQREEALRNAEILGLRVDYLGERVKTYQDLVQHGLMLKSKLFDMEQDHLQTKLKMRQAKTKAQELDARRKEIEEKQASQLLQLKNQVEDVEHDISVLKKQLSNVSEVVSPFGGIVTDVAVERGGIINSGQRVVTLENLDDRPKRSLVMSAFVTAFQGEKIHPGMEMRITPSTVKQEEYGYMLGTVTEVAAFPVSQAGLQAALGDSSLAETLLRQGPMISVQGSLIEDRGTESGFRWSSTRGAHIQVNAGTVSSVEVVVREQPPITLVLPKLRKLFGITYD